jgi:hypothetical protein
MNNRTTAVWVYWAGGAEGEELRYSIRSTVANFVDLQNVVLCGDRPDWYSGDFIHSPRWNKQDAKARFGTGRWSKWSDSIMKLQRIIDSQLVTDDFLWMYDDTFLTKPLTASELKIPRATGQLCVNMDVNARNTWREAMRRTAIALVESGRPTRNYSHHGPIVYSKQKLQQTIDRYDPFSRPRLIESLYMNHHYDSEQAVQIGNWLQYTKSPSPIWQPRSDASVVNVGSFRASVEIAMEARFPDACNLESFPIPSGAKVSRTAPVRVRNAGLAVT